MDQPEGMIPVEEFARMKDMPPEKVIRLIKDGFYIGRLADGQWYVDIGEAASLAGAPVSSNYQSEYGVARVVAKSIAFLGWVVIWGSLAIFLLVLVAVSQPVGPDGSLIFAGIMSGLGMVVFGLNMIVGAQIMRATVDNADHTREILHLLRNRP